MQGEAEQDDRRRAKRGDVENKESRAMQSVTEQQRRAAEQQTNHRDYTSRNKAEQSRHAIQSEKCVAMRKDRTRAKRCRSTQIRTAQTSDIA